MSGHETDFQALRALMLERDIAGRGIHDLNVLDAMGDVPRQAFVPDRYRRHAYEDAPLPIPGGQTISQPYIVAVMLQALDLQGDERALDVGTGSGYAAAVLSRLVRHVYTIEQDAGLAASAARRFLELGYDNITVHHGDGRLGWPAYAPYDAIVVAAAAAEVPDPLLDQLAEGGRLVIPIGSRWAQDLLRIERTGAGEYEREFLEPVRFVPLI